MKPNRINQALELTRLVSVTFVVVLSASSLLVPAQVVRAQTGTRPASMEAAEV